jgi:hypothetical protein
MTTDLPPMTDAAIERVALGLLDGTLPYAEWTHAAHFAAALWLLRHRPAIAATGMPAVIRAYNLAGGRPNTDTAGFHATITAASMRIAAAWLRAAPGDAPLSSVLADLLASPWGARDALLRCWSADRLSGAAARRDWCEPDLAPLRFPGDPKD